MLIRIGIHFKQFLKPHTSLNCTVPKLVRTREYFDKMKRACVLVAPGSEEMETITAVDVLRRAGIKVDLTGIKNVDPVECSRKVIVVPDVDIDEALQIHYDVVILPGGLGGAEALSKSSKVKQLLQKQELEQKYIAAICAAPTVLLTHSICVGKVLTCYPAMADIIRKDGRYKYAECDVIIDDKLITSRGPGTAISFALKIVEKLMDIDTAKKVAQALLVCYPDCMKVGEQ